MFHGHGSRACRLIVSALCCVLVFGALFQPFSIYASIALQEENTQKFEESDAVESKSDSQAGDSAEVSGNSYESEISGAQSQPSQSVRATEEDAQPASGGNGESAQLTDAAVSDMNNETGLDDKREDKANSWRYKDGQRIDVSSEGNGISTFSMSFLPEGASAQGIDVSSWQGVIDWQKVKDAGIDFAIIRLGWWVDGKDAYLERNVAECERLGIPWGAYLYSYCSNPSQASAEADHALDLLGELKAKGYTPDLPVYFDMEDNALLNGNRDFAGMATQFCSKIEAAGYMAGVYANLNWWNNNLTSSVFDSWNRWVAQYYSACTYEGTYSAWQYTSRGSVPGISGNVDLNWWYGDFPGYSLDYYSSVFDPDYYLDNNPDVKMACGNNPYAALRHFINYGMSEGRRSSPDFDIASYYNANRDLRQAFGMDLPRYYEHYVEFGSDEGRPCSGAPEITRYVTARGGVDWSPVYDGAYYRERNADVEAAYTEDFGSVELLDDSGMLAHFVTYGMGEGRSAALDFNVVFYRSRYPDLQKAFGSSLRDYYIHYVEYGRFEGRIGNDWAS